MRRDTPLLLYAPIHILDDTPLFLQLRTYLMDSIFLNQKTFGEIRDGEDLWQWSWLEIRLNTFLRSTIPQKQFIIKKQFIIQILYSLKYKHSKKEYILYKKNQKSNSTMSVMICAGANFAKKNSCLVARIVPYYTAGLDLLTFHILEPYPSKDITLGLSHVISY